MKYLINVLDFVDPLRDEFVLFVKPLNLLEAVPESLLVDILVGTFRPQTLLKSVLNDCMTKLDFLLHVFGDDML